FMLVPSFTVAQNIVMSREPRRAGIFFDNKRAEEITRELVDEYGLYVDPSAPVQDVSVGVQQRVEILKALYRGADILILDEPTAVLTPQETAELFGSSATSSRKEHDRHPHNPQARGHGHLRPRRHNAPGPPRGDSPDTKDITEKQIASMMVGARALRQAGEDRRAGRDDDLGRGPLCPRQPRPRRRQRP
ncbi:MAG: ATP-binding cassette domain-containing protein, partial [Oscillospiraceae bacterium]